MASLWDIAVGIIIALITLYWCFEEEERRVRERKQRQAEEDEKERRRQAEEEERRRQEEDEKERRRQEEEDEKEGRRQEEEEENERRRQAEEERRQAEGFLEVACREFDDWQDTAKRRFLEKLQPLAKQGELQKLKDAARQIRKQYESPSLPTLERELRFVRKLRSTRIQPLAFQMAFANLVHTCEIADGLFSREHRDENLGRLLIGVEQSRCDLRDQQRMIRSVGEHVASSVEKRDQLRKRHIDRLEQVQYAQKRCLDAALRESAIVTSRYLLKAAFNIARDAKDAEPRIGSRAEPARCSNGEIELSVAVAGEAFKSYLERCSFKQVAANTEDTISLLKRELQSPSVFDWIANCDDDDRVADHTTIEECIFQAHESIKAERHFWKDLDEAAILPSTQLLAVGRAALQDLSAMLQRHFDMQQHHVSILVELEREIGFLRPEKVSEIVCTCKHVWESQLDAKDACDDAMLAIKRARQRDMLVDVSMVDRVAEKKKMVRLANDQVHQCVVELIQNMQSLPELEKQPDVRKILCGVSSDLAPLWRMGRELSHFDDLKQIPGESRHVVYSGSYDGNMFAIKEFSLTCGREGFRACLREAAILARIQHPHIAEVVALFCDLDQNKMFLQMPYYDSGSLREWVVNKKPTDVCVRRVLLQVVMALAYIHDLGITHADVKSANILMDGRGCARLIDFDISVDAATKTSTAFAKKTKQVGYTQGYAAPELFRDGASDATDMYAFGAVVKEVSLESPDRDNLAGKLLMEDPTMRPTANQLLRDVFFDPVYAWRSHERRNCCICLETGHPLDQGVECGNADEPHFVCDNCLDSHVHATIGAELRLQQVREGRVWCPGHRCGSQVYPDVDLAKHLPTATFNRYIQGRVSLLEQKHIEEADMQMKTRLEAELKRLQALSDEQRRVLTARNHIIENILTLKCPRSRCRQAFIDFEGCFALSCSKCSCKFCGWCFKDCGDDDAHPHVQSCDAKPLDADVFFGTLEQFNTSNKNRQAEELHVHLETLDPQLRAAVLRDIRQELRDLGLKGFL